MKCLTAIELDEMQQREEDFLLVNTLAEEHFDKTKISGAVNIPQQDADFVERVEKQAGSKDRLVVVYCADRDCQSSAKAAEQLEEGGFTNVRDFETGAKGWKETGHRMANV